MQYTVKNLRGGFAPNANVILRTHDRATAVSWLHYSVTPKLRDRGYYGLRAMERRAAAIVQYALPGIGRDVYSPEG